MPTPNLNPDALAFLKKVEAEFARQILFRILELCQDPYPNDALKLRGTVSAYFRVRVGDFRIIYKIAEDDLVIEVIGKRTDGEVYDEVRRKGL